MSEFLLWASYTAATEEKAEHWQVRRQHASMSLHGQSWRQRVLIFFSSLSQESEDELKPVFILTDVNIKFSLNLKGAELSTA